MLKLEALTGDGSVGWIVGHQQRPKPECLLKLDQPDA